MVLATSTHADVELKSSDNNQLLINGNPALTSYKLYDSDNTLIPNATVIMVEGSGQNATVSIALESGDIMLSIYSDKTVEETAFLYNGESCSVIGYNPYPDSIIDIDISIISSPPNIIRPSYAIEKKLRAYDIYEVSNNTITGYTTKSSCEDQETDNYKSGFSVTYDSVMTTEFNEFLDSLTALPIYVRY